MLKFFRKIRQKLLSENKFSKYLLYAIGEIILVVIGILLALQINFWSERNKQIKSSEKALHELRKEIDSTTALIHRKNSVNLQASEIMKRFLENGYTNPTDSIKNRVVGYCFAYVPLQLSIPTLEREIGTNGLIMEQEALILELQKFKNLLFVVEQQQFYLDNYWDQNLITFLKEKGLMLAFVGQAGQIKTSAGGLEELYDSEEFKDLVAMEYFHVDAYAKTIVKLEKQLKIIKEKLQSIIHSNE